MRAKQLVFSGILLGIFFLAFVAHATMTTTFESSNGRKYTITSRQVGTALSFGKRWLYDPAPILPCPQTNNRYVFLFVTCQFEGGSCAIQTQALYKSESTDGLTYSSPKLLLTNPSGVVDFIAPRAIWNGRQWNIYVQGVKQGRPNAVYLATGATLDSLNWVPGSDGQAKEIITSIDPYTGAGIGEGQQWFNTAAYGGYPGYTIYSVYNDWNYPNMGGYEFTMISGDGTNVQQWYGPVFPAYSAAAGVLLPDVMLANSSDAATKGDPSFTLGNGCFEGQTRYSPLVGLGFYSAPYTYKNGAWFSDGMVGEVYKSNPGYYDAVIETSGPNNSGFSPRFARNLYGYVEPVSYNPTTWKTFVYYNNSQINENDTDGCPSAGFSINGFRNHVQSFGVTEITIAEAGGPAPLVNLSVTKSGSGSGTVTSSPAGITCGATCTAGFTNGSAVTLTASPGAGSMFVGWSGACSGGGSCILTMDAAKSVTAAFNPAPANYVGCFTDDGNRALPAQLSSGGETVESCVQKVAAAGNAYAGLQWYGECWAGNTPGYGQVADTECNTPCNANPGEMCGGPWHNSIYRTGVTPSKTLSVTKSGSGSGSVTSSPAGINCGATCTANFATGTPVTLTASPAGGSTFAGWSGACSGTGSCTVTMSAAQSATATFNVAVAGPQISAIVDGITYSYAISPTTTIAIFGSGFSIGSNIVQFQRAGYADVWLYNGDGHYFWDGNGTQINASLDSRVASGTWNVTIRNASGGVSNPYSLTIQGSAGSNAYYCYSSSYASFGYQNWLCNTAYHPTYCYTINWQSTSCPSAGGISATCGNGICEAGENGSNCGQDCCDQTTVCGQTKQNQGVYYCRNMYHYDNGSASWHGFQWVTANDTIQMCNETWEAQEGSYYQTQYQCGGYTGKCHSIPGGYY